MPSAAPIAGGGAGERPWYMNYSNAALMEMIRGNPSLASTLPREVLLGFPNEFFLEHPPLQGILPPERRASFGPGALSESPFTPGPKGPVPLPTFYDQPPPGGTALPVSTGPLTGTASTTGTKSDVFPENWRNMTIPQLMAGFSPAALARLPVEALVTFSNGDLQQVIDANPAILGDIPADRLVQFPGEALSLFVKNLEARGDYTTNQKIRAQVDNLRGAMQQGGLTEPARALPVTTTPLPSAPPGATPTPGAGAPPSGPPAPGSSAPGAGGTPTRSLPLPRLAQPTGIRAGMSPTELYLALSGIPSGPERVGNRGFSRLLSEEEGGGEGGGGEGGDTEGGGAPTGFIIVRDPLTGLPKLVRDPTYRQPGAGRTFDPERKTREERDIEREGEQARAEAKIAQATADREQRKAEFEYQKATNARDFEAAERWRGIAQQWAEKKFTAEQEIATADRALRAELGYAESRRADVRTGLERAGTTGYYEGQPTFAREREFSDVERANLTTLSNRAYQAAQVALSQGNQAEAQRQFNIAQNLRDRQFGLEEELGRGRLGLETELGRAQSGLAQQRFGLESELGRGRLGLEGELGRGRLGLEERGQTEAERQGTFRRGLEASEFQFQVERDPAAAFTKAINAGNLLTPGGGVPSQSFARVGPAVGGYSRIAGVPGQAGFATTGAPQGVQQAFTDNPNVSRQVRNLFSEGEFRIPSAQGLSGLLPSQRQQLGAGLRTLGYQPEDVEAASEKLTTTTLPSQSVRRSRPRARTGGVY